MGPHGRTGAGDEAFRQLQHPTSPVDIATAAARQLPPGTLVDGELVVWHDGRLDFTQLLRRMASPTKALALARRHPASYVMFDVLQHQGRTLADQPQRVRRRVLETILPTLTPPLQVVPSTRDRDIAAQWFTDYATADVGIEGLVLKAQPGSIFPAVVPG